MIQPEDRDIESGTEIERTVYFSDAVFAIAITLLALNLEVPDIPPGLVATELPQRLLELWPRFSSFIISFGIVGSLWLLHHRIFHAIRAYDRRLLLLNLLFLMWVALVPVSASLLGKYGGQQISVIIYDCHMIIASLTLSWLWWHASSNPNLVDPSLDPRLREYNHLRALIAPSVFVLSIAISFIDVHAAEYSLLLLLLIRPALRWYVLHDRRPSA